MFGDMQIKQNADGMGISGVCTSELDFSVAYEEYAEHPPKAGAIVTLGINILGVTYYFLISQRTRSGAKVTLKCYDRMLLLNKNSDLFDIPYTNVDPKDDSSGEIKMEDLIKYLVPEIGFAGCTTYLTDTGYYGELKMAKKDIKGKTCRALFEAISEAWCGYFTIAADNYLDFVFFGTPAHSICPVVNHEAIVMQSERSPISKVTVSNGTDNYYSGEENADIFAALTVKTNYASQELADKLLERVKGYTYMSWQCSKMIVDVQQLSGSVNSYLPAISTEMYSLKPVVSMNGGNLIANALTITLTDTGIYASLGSNEVAEDECAYIGYLSRKLEEKLSDGEKLGNDTLISRYQGIIHLGEKTKDETTGEEKQNRYGYSKATADGIVEFDGAMVSKITPKTAYWNSDKTEAVVSYEGKKFKYNIKRDSEGNITDFSKEEVKEESE